LLPSEAVTTDRLNQLYTLYREASSLDLITDLEFLLKFQKLDQRVVLKVTEIIISKVEADPAIAHTLLYENEK